METLDIHGIDDNGVHTIIIHNVSTSCLTASGLIFVLTMKYTGIRTLNLTYQMYGLHI